MRCWKSFQSAFVGRRRPPSRALGQSLGCPRRKVHAHADGGAASIGDRPLVVHPPQCGSPRPARCCLCGLLKTLKSVSLMLQNTPHRQKLRSSQRARTGSGADWRLCSCVRWRNLPTRPSLSWQSSPTCSCMGTWATSSSAVVVHVCLQLELPVWDSRLIYYMACGLGAFALHELVVGSALMSELGDVFPVSRSVRVAQRCALQRAGAEMVFDAY